MQLVFIHVAYVCESSRWSTGFCRSDSFLVFFQLSVWVGETSVKGQMAKARPCRPCGVSHGSHGCGPVRPPAQSRLAAGRPGPQPLSLPACRLSPHRLLTGCIQTSAYCGFALCIPRAWFRKNEVQTCLFLFLAIVPHRDFVCVPAVTIIMLCNSPLQKPVAQNKKPVFGSRAWGEWSGWVPVAGLALLGPLTCLVAGCSRMDPLDV